jgi:RNA polymerase sigma-70 factor, ECF subfamily
MGAFDEVGDEVFDKARQREIPGQALPSGATLSFGWCSFTMGRAMTGDLDPDAALMMRVREGDLEAFEALVEKFKQPVYNLVCRTLHDPTEAEDVSQNVFVQVYKSAARYRVTARFSTWLFTIARNLCLNELRRRSRHPADSLEQAGSPEENPAGWQFEDVKAIHPTDLVLRGELEAKVQEAIDALPEKQRIALLLCREEELSYEDIGEVLGCSLSATKSLIHRARETLKSQLKPYLESGAWEEDGS